MSELDRDNAKSIDDDETDDIEEIQDEIDQEVQVAEQTDRSSLQTQLRAFFELFIIERNQLLLKSKFLGFVEAPVGVFKAFMEWLHHFHQKYKDLDLDNNDKYTNWSLDKP